MIKYQLELNYTYPTKSHRCKLHKINILELYHKILYFCNYSEKRVKNSMLIRYNYKQNTLKELFAWDNS